VHHDRARHQKSVDQIELPLEDRGAAPGAERSGEARPAAQGDERSGLDPNFLMERVIEGGNLRRALKRVQQNKGSPGVDGLTVDELPAFLTRHWPTIREQLLTGRYQPSVVKRVEIPKSSGGVRRLGIPTVLDRVGVPVTATLVVEPPNGHGGDHLRPGALALDVWRHVPAHSSTPRRAGDTGAALASEGSIQAGAYGLRERRPAARCRAASVLASATSVSQSSGGVPRARRSANTRYASVALP
jgi:hypothetical protein